MIRDDGRIDSEQSEDEVDLDELHNYKHVPLKIGRMMKVVLRHVGTIKPRELPDECYHDNASEEET